MKATQEGESPGLRDCPTPIDKSQKLITQKVHLEMCLSRQSARYHKCYACKWRGTLAKVEREATAL